MFISLRIPDFLHKYHQRMVLLLQSVDTKKSNIGQDQIQKREKYGQG